MRGDGPRDEFKQSVAPLRSQRPANHNYSVWFSDDPRVFHRLQWGGCTVVRTRDPNRFTSALAHHLSGHGAPPPGLVRTDGILAVHDARATVLPPTLRQQIPAYERPLREAGVILRDAPWVDVDPCTGESVVRSSALPATQFDELLDRLPAAQRPDPVPEPGKYALAGWYFATNDPGEPEMSLTDAVATVLTRLRAPLADTDQPAAVARMLSELPFGYMKLSTPRQLLERLRG